MIFSVCLFVCLFVCLCVWVCCAYVYCFFLLCTSAFIANKRVHIVLLTYLLTQLFIYFRSAAATQYYTEYHGIFHGTQHGAKPLITPNTTVQSGAATGNQLRQSFCKLMHCIQ